jgi:catechol 2,3-dioxygenase-like lactoylglutathione lyase family enzyme
MFAQVAISTENRDATERFYRTVLGALGIGQSNRTADIVAWDDFAILAAEPEHPPKSDAG